MMDILPLINSSNLIAAAPVGHGYRNVWIRDMYYVGICSSINVRQRLWDGMTAILDRYKDKLSHHTRNEPREWYEHLHIRYTPDGFEIGNEQWCHNQFDSIGNFLDVAVDQGRLDLAELLVDYLKTIGYADRPSAGAWEDRNSCDAYSVAACLHGLQRAKVVLPHKRTQIEGMVRQGCNRLYGALLPYATNEKLVCLSLLGVIWPFDVAGPYRDEIISIVKSKLMREPYGFIRYEGDKYDGEHFNRGAGREVPWLLGDCWMAKIEPNNILWRLRLEAAKKKFGCMPEAYFPETMTMNRNSPLLWAEAMYNSITPESRS